MCGSLTSEEKYYSALVCHQEVNVIQMTDAHISCQKSLMTHPQKNIQINTYSRILSSSIRLFTNLDKDIPQVLTSATLFQKWHRGLLKLNKAEFYSF